MFKKIFSITVLATIAISGFLSAEIQYEIQDIGTLQTHSSQAIAINNNGQILGWYNIDNSNPSPTSNSGKHYFLRDRDRSFHELPIHNGGGAIDWRYLVDDGKAYGIHDYGSGARLYMWDQTNGVVNLGNLPGKEISAINNAGQVLIKSVIEIENGKTVRRPIIWHNGVVTKLRGLEGNIGIESDESYGYDMNNNGDVVGNSVALLSYKNNLYKQVHAVKWINGQSIDLHKDVPKSESTSATTINDLGDVIISSYLLRADGERLIGGYSGTKATNTKYFLSERCFCDRFKNETNVKSIVSRNILADDNSIWLRFVKFVSMNDSGEIIVQAQTIYGEEHCMLLIPIKSE